MSLADPFPWISAALACAVAWLVVVVRRERASAEAAGRALAAASEKLLADVSAVTATRADAVEHVRRTTQTMTQLTHGAMSTVVSAETVVGLALQAAGAGGADGSPERVHRLETALRDVAKSARQIAKLAQQQEARFDEVLRAMNDIYLATERSLEATERLGAEARALDGLAHRLGGTGRPPDP